jgi:hypothetical protein
MVQTRIRDLFALREQGRITVERLKADGRLRFAAARSPEEYRAVHDWVIQRIDALERDQAKSFFSIAPHDVSFSTEKPRSRRQPN